jgi:hypothetical protein
MKKESLKDYAEEIVLTIISIEKDGFVAGYIIFGQELFQRK